MDRNVVFWPRNDNEKEPKTEDQKNLHAAWPFQPRTSRLKSKSVNKIYKYMAVLL